MGVFFGFGFGFGGLFEGAEVLGGGHVDFLAGEEVLDGEELEAGVFGVGDGFGLEEGGFGGFFAHGEVGDSRVMKTPMAAESRSMTPRRSRIWEAVTWPALTWRMMVLVSPAESVR